MQGFHQSTFHIYQDSVLSSASMSYPYLLLIRFLWEKPCQFKLAHHIWKSYFLIIRKRVHLIQFFQITFQADSQLFCWSGKLSQPALSTKDFFRYPKCNWVDRSNTLPFIPKVLSCCYCWCQSGKGEGSLEIIQNLPLALNKYSKKGMLRIF